MPILANQGINIYLLEYFLHYNQLFLHPHLIKNDLQY